MNEYQAFYEDRFVQNLARYSNLRQRIRRRVEQIRGDPYASTERLGRVADGLDLRGLPQCAGRQKLSADFCCL